MSTANFSRFVLRVRRSFFRIQRGCARAYNNILEDLHSHFGKRDSYVRTFSAFEELNEPTINDVAEILKLAMNISQIVFYMTRWT